VGFEPIFGKHAIERCGLTLSFNQPLPDKAFGKLLADTTDRIGAEAGLTKTQRPTFGIKIDLKTQSVSQENVQPPATFSTPDDSIQMILMPEAIVWLTTNYIRWPPFINQFKTVADDILNTYLDALTPTSIRLEYWDRFIWSGTWEDMKPSELIRPDSQCHVPHALKAKREWHSHAGWFKYFDQPQTGIRRQLTNINIDAISATRKIDGVEKPSIGIYTMMQNEGTAETKVAIFEQLNELHFELLKLFEEVVTPNTADQIGLKTGVSK